MLSIRRLRPAIDPTFLDVQEPILRVQSAARHEPMELLGEVNDSMGEVLGADIVASFGRAWGC